jgi:quinoprotein glucose dehydrogenase
MVAADPDHPANVSKLKVAWTYRTGDFKGPGDPGETTNEVTPIKIGDTVYLCTPHANVVALDAETGRQKWKFDPKKPCSKTCST